MPFLLDANRPAWRVLELLPLEVYRGPQFSWLPGGSAHRGGDRSGGGRAARALHRRHRIGRLPSVLEAVRPTRTFRPYHRTASGSCSRSSREDFDVVTVDLHTAAVTELIATERAETMPGSAAAKDALVYVTDINGGPEIWLHEPSRPDRPLVAARHFPTSETQFLVGPALSPDGARQSISASRAGGGDLFCGCPRCEGGHAAARHERGEPSSSRALGHPMAIGTSTAPCEGRRAYA